MHQADSQLLYAFDKYKDNQSNTWITVFFFFNIIKTIALQITIYSSLTVSKH